MVFDPPVKERGLGSFHEQRLVIEAMVCSATQKSHKKNIVLFCFETSEIFLWLAKQ